MKYKLTKLILAYLTIPADDTRDGRAHNKMIYVTWWPSRTSERPVSRLHQAYGNSSQVVQEMIEYPYSCVFYTISILARMRKRCGSCPGHDISWSRDLLVATFSRSRMQGIMLKSYFHEYHDGVMFASALLCFPSVAWLSVKAYDGSMFYIYIIWCYRAGLVCCIILISHSEIAWQTLLIVYVGIPLVNIS